MSHFEADQKECPEIKKPSPIVIDSEYCIDNQYLRFTPSHNHLSVQYFGGLKHSPKARGERPITPSSALRARSEPLPGEGRNSGYSLGHVSSPQESVSLWNVESKSISVLREAKYEVALHLGENDTETYVYSISTQCMGNKFKAYLERNKASDDITHVYLPSYIGVYWKESYKLGFILYLLCAVQEAHTIDDAALTEQDIFFLLLVAYRFKDTHPIELLVDICPFLEKKFPLLALIREEENLWRRIEGEITSRKIGPSKGFCVLL